jgi:hypothetical protein
MFGTENTKANSELVLDADFSQQLKPCSEATAQITQDLAAVNSDARKHLVVAGS